MMMLFEADGWTYRKLLNLKALEITLKEIRKYFLHILFFWFDPVKGKVINILLDNYQRIALIEILWIYGAIRWVWNYWCHVEHFLIVIFLFRFSVYLLWLWIEIKWMMAEWFLFIIIYIDFTLDFVLLSFLQVDVD